MLKKSGARWHDLEVSVEENSSFFFRQDLGFSFFISQSTLEDFDQFLYFLNQTLCYWPLLMMIILIYSCIWSAVHGWWCFFIVCADSHVVGLWYCLRTLKK